MYVMTKEYKFKIVMLGTFAVGKTSLVKRFVYDQFDDSYLTTIGVRVSKKEVVIKINGGEARVTLLLWDIAGSNGFTRISPEYLKGASGAIFVSDLTRLNTLDEIKTLRDSLLNASPAAKCLVAHNKVDLIDSNGQILDELIIRADRAFSETGIPYLMTSAKDGSNVEKLFTSLTELILAQTV